MNKFGTGELYGINFASQGWQYPICKRVYSPATPMCYYCGNGTTVSSATAGDSKKQVIENIKKAFEKQVIENIKKAVEPRKD